MSLILQGGGDPVAPLQQRYCLLNWSFSSNLSRFCNLYINSGSVILLEEVETDDVNMLLNLLVLYDFWSLIYEKS